MEAANTPVVQDQSAVAALLADPATHGVDKVDTVETHAAMVFLAGSRAYKVKRAVRYPYMDFSTLELRHRHCIAEVALNRRTAPQLYFGVVPITRAADAHLELGGHGTIIEWVVAMHRFDQDGLFDRLAAAGRLEERIVRAAATAVSHFHRTAEVLTGDDAVGGGYDGMCWVIDENLEELRERPDLFAAAQVETLAAASLQALDNCRELLETRQRLGFVRRCHGDLHLRNICMIDGRPTIFDGIEFNDRLSNIDVLYDLAFLLMDLEHRGLRRFGNLILSEYVQHFGPSIDGLAALPLFLSTRACVRAKISASIEASLSDEAVRQRMRQDAADYFALARAMLVDWPPQLIAVGGLSGTGKTSLARRLAPLIGNAPGALHLRSDVTRKALWGIDELAQLPNRAYSQDMTRRVYTTLEERAQQALRAGHSVIVDAVHLDPEERTRIEDIARANGASFHGLWLEAPEHTLLHRVSGRQRDASDATADIVRAQLQTTTGDIGWHRLDADRPMEQIVQAILPAIVEGPTDRVHDATNDRSCA